MYLELAEGPTTRNPYLFIPNFEGGEGGVFIREDKFDSMPDEQYKALLNILGPFQPKEEGGLNEGALLASRSERKEQRSRRREAKTAKKEARSAEKASKTARKEERSSSRAEARSARAEKRANREPFDFKGAIDTVGGVVSKFTGKGGEEIEALPGSGEAKPFYKNPIVLIGGALAIGGIAYLATRRK